MTETTFKRLLQLGIVVPDAPQAAKNFCTLFALAESAVEIIDTTQTAQPIRVHGQVVTAGLLLAKVSVAQVEFEFIQPLSGASSQQEFLQAHGPGIQHICIDVDHYDAMRQRMAALGGETLSAGGEGAYSYCYMDLREKMGLIFELYNDGLRDALQKNTDL